MKVDVISKVVVAVSDCVVAILKAIAEGKDD